MAPEALLSHLNRADGSATYTQNGYSIIGAVNGPLEVQRRDELPSEATVEVNVRPAIGVGSPKERHLETLLASTLRTIILTRHIPRTLVQITLQVRSLPSEHAICGVDASLSLLPHLIHTALLALLSSSMPLRTTVTAALVVLPAGRDAAPMLQPTARDVMLAKPIQSAHVFAFSGNGKVLLNESDGSFTYEEWEEACEMAEEVCCKEGGVGLSDAMQVDGGSENLERWLREVVRRKVEKEMRWKSGT
ncbi:uncharacterized protein EI97DRAFT_491536 [Westerdykella ornata]|uniref:Exoribonuclease phosphorolytic domain-containing protein n=1 Tax=Westerdykella ornata TaxID=318751 RepID=A0A6A6JW65_WESOR|nr:uncharacterized protein EI97DRAFT_491536 [Westerdykella ornata]KAF2279976.1 hypothetical protein EI97DRAFT_491536 [Westerdykella ornata]